MIAEDTIVAQATPQGRGGIGVVRVSGPAVARIAQALTGRTLSPRHATYTAFADADGHPLDHGIALYFPAPASFTGEDVLELHGHGGPVVMALLLRRVLELGARVAEPGEFTLRAYLNERIDLAQAEAVADLIDATTEEAARAAIRTLDGELSRRVAAVSEALAGLRAYVEAAIDFPDEDVDFLAAGEVGGRLEAIAGRLRDILATARQGRLLRDGITVVIAGPPNAGKSTLLNRLAGYDAAIVTDVPGTTRDVVREQLDLEGVPVHVLDTAGLRDGGDAIEREGMRRTRAALERADCVLLVVDDTAVTEHALAALTTGLPAGPAVTVVRNKIDLSGSPASEAPGLTHDAPAAGSPAIIRLSALTGAGVAALRSHLLSTVGYRAGESGELMARARHLTALQAAAGHVETARARAGDSDSVELVAEDLRLAREALDAIVGGYSTEDLLGDIFSRFCIGK